MAAIAPCAHYGCGCGHFDHLRNCHSSGTMQQGASMILRMQRLLPEHRPFKQKQWEANQLVKHCPTQEVGPFVKAISDQPVTLRWMHTLSLLSVCIQRSQMLGALLRLHPAIVATQFCNVKNNIAWLFPDDGDVDGAGAFLHSLLWNKEAMGQSTLNEASKFTALLRKQAQQTDLRKVPACCARAWLLQIWKDVTSARPNRDLLVGCCVRDLYSAAFQMMEDLWWAFGRAFVIGHPKKPSAGAFPWCFRGPAPYVNMFYFAPCQEHFLSSRTQRCFAGQLWCFWPLWAQPIPGLQRKLHRGCCGDPGVICAQSGQRCVDAFMLRGVGVSHISGVSLYNPWPKQKAWGLLNLESWFHLKTFKGALSLC